MRLGSFSVFWRREYAKISMKGVSGMVRPFYLNCWCFGVLLFGGLDLFVFCCLVAN